MDELGQGGYVMGRVVGQNGAWGTLIFKGRRGKRRHKRARGKTKIRAGPRVQGVGSTWEKSGVARSPLQGLASEVGGEKR